MKMPPLTLEQVKNVCINAKATAPGLDHWDPRDFANFSDNAFGMITMMFNTIEDGASWPAELLKARAAFMSKDAEKYDNPLNYRVLTLLPVAYRRYATARLHSIKAWVASWDLPQICAGGIAKGAQDGWYRTAVQIENICLKGRWHTGGAIDIRKCFDQMPRTQLYALAKKAGMPQKLLETYMQFQEKITTYNTVQGGLGIPYKKSAVYPKETPYL